MFVSVCDLYVCGSVCGVCVRLYAMCVCVYVVCVCIRYVCAQVIRQLGSQTQQFRVLALSATPGADIRVGLALFSGSLRVPSPLLLCILMTHHQYLLRNVLSLSLYFPVPVSLSFSPHLRQCSKSSPTC